MSGNVGFIPFISRAARKAAMVSAYVEEGLSLSQVGARFGVGKHTVHGILRSMPDVAMRAPGFGEQASRRGAPRAIVALPCGAFSVELTRGYSTVIDACDVDLAKAFAWRVQGDVGSRRLYAIRNTRVGRRFVVEFFHRSVLSAGPGDFVDHRNGDTLDNRRQNLRLFNASENARNRRIGRNNTSGYKGVYRSRGKFRAQIRADGRQHFIGMFADPVSAARAYNAKALEMHGEYARLNDLGEIA